MDSLRIRIAINGQAFDAVLDGSPSGRAVARALPLRLSGKLWGGEVFFPFPLDDPLPEGRTCRPAPGALAYWAEARSLCLFLGPTPVSFQNRILAAAQLLPVGLAGPEGLPDPAGLEQPLTVTLERSVP